MPNLSPTMVMGNIIDWKKKEGDPIKVGDVLANIETDKAQVDFEVNEEGYLAKIIFPAGSKEVKVGTPIAIVVEEKNDVNAFKDYNEGAHEQPATAKEEPQKVNQPTPQSAKTSEKKFPSHIKLKMPNLSPTMTKGVIVDWKKKEGSQIKVGEVLASIETDKAQVDFEVNEDGYVAKLLYPAGAKDVNVGSLIAILVENQNDISAFKDYSEEGEVSKAEVKKPEPSTSEVAQKVSQTPQTQKGDRVFASPLARKTANELGMEIKEVQGTGPRGRIIQADVLDAKSSQKVAIVEKLPEVEKIVQTEISASAGYEDIEINTTRKVIAERLLFSKTNIPHFYINIECNVDKLSSLRNELNKHSTVKLSFNDIVIKAASLACMKVPESNSSWQGTFIRKYKNVDMSVAVQTEFGLITPIIFNSNLKGLEQISKEMKDLAERARLKKLKLQEFQGGTFSISNMGMYGITNFSAIINPPQACILAIGKIDKKVIYDENAKDKNQPYKVSTILCATLSCDHRVVDGAIGATWVQEFKRLVENPELMLL